MLALRKEKIVDVARTLGENQKSISDALNELRKNFRVRDKIAAHLGLSYEQCWGEEEPSEAQLRSRGPKLRLATPPETPA